MQSEMASWQYENFSSAEFSPPISPAPSSPTLYSNSSHGAPFSPASPSSIIGYEIDGVSGEKMLQSSRNSAPGSALSRAQMASSLLKDLEQLGDMHFKTEDYDVDMDWNDESVNLELFQELSEISYTPPVSPNPEIPSEEISSSSPSPYPAFALNQQNIQQQHVEDFSSFITPTVPVPETFEKLTAEFQAILESLPTNIEAYGEVIDIAGMGIQSSENDQLIPLMLEADAEAATSSAFDESFIGAEMEIGSESGESQSDYIDEQEVYQILDDEDSNTSNSNSYFLSGPSSPESSVIDEDDRKSIAVEKILDALLQGDLSEAELYINDVEQLPVQNVSESSQPSVSFSGGVVVDSPTNLKCTSQSSNKNTKTTTAKKPSTERRGRKATNGTKRNGMGFVNDKAIRKKEQNKTAATRYRQKKKMETAVTLTQEEILQKEHGELAKQKEDLLRQIVMVKQLLREVFTVRKNQAVPKASSSKSIKGGVNGHKF